MRNTQSEEWIFAFSFFPFRCLVYLSCFLPRFLSISPAEPIPTHAAPPLPFPIARVVLACVLSVMDDANANGGAEVLSLVLVVSCPCSWLRNRLVFRGKWKNGGKEGWNCRKGEVSQGPIHSPYPFAPRPDDMTFWVRVSSSATQNVKEMNTIPDHTILYERTPSRNSQTPSTCTCTCTPTCTCIC